MKVKARADDYTIAIQKDEYDRMFTEKRAPEQIRSQVDEIRKHYDFFKQINNQRLEPGETTTVIYGKDSSGNYSQFHVIHRRIQDIDRKERKGYIYITLNECIHSWYLLSLIGIADYTLYDILELPPIPSEYVVMPQSSATELLNRITHNQVMRAGTDANGKSPITKRTTDSKVDYKLPENFDTAACMFIDVIKLAYQKQKSRIAAETDDSKRFTVYLSLSDYMEYRGLSDRKEAAQQYRNITDLLKNIDITATEKIKGRSKTKTITGILQGRLETEIETTRGGKPFKYNQIFGVVLSVNMLEYLITTQDQLMYYPKALLKLSSKYDAGAYHLGRYLAWLNRIQVGTLYQNHHNLTNVVECCGFMDIAESNKKFSRIRDNLQTALEKLIDIGVLQRYDITDQDGNRTSFDNIATFDGLYIDVTTTMPPDKEQHLINARQKRAESIKKAKQKSP